MQLDLSDDDVELLREVLDSALDRLAPRFGTRMTASTVRTSRVDVIDCEASSTFLTANGKRNGSSQRGRSPH
jgi:hypothetical protein